MSVTDPANHPLQITRGDCLPILVSWSADGEPVDLTGFTAELAIAWLNPPHRQDLTEGSLQIEEAALSNDGEIAFSVPSQTTRQWTEYHAVFYQVRVTQPDACVRTLLRGKIMVARAIAEEV